MTAFRHGRAGKFPLTAGFMLMFGGLAALATAQTPKDAKPARDDTKVPVPLPTADHAELSGTFYRGTTSRGRDTPCVLMIHDRGKDSSKTAWDALARTLQNAGYAVLTFDLRGHGRSTTVTKDFWNPQFANIKSGFKGTGLAKTTTINSEFKPSYWPWLTQDLAAARRFLDIKNDAGELNSGSIIVIGAGEGASLGLLWVATEFDRQYLVGFLPLKSQGTPRLGGDDIAGCVWLSAQSRTKEGGHYNLDTWIRSYPGIREKVPMGFVYGEKDAAAKRDAELWMRTLKTVGGKDNPRPNRLIEIKGTELAGQNLLTDTSFGVTEKVIAYCDDIMKARKAIAWERKETDTNPIQLVNVNRFGFRLP